MNVKELASILKVEEYEEIKIMLRLPAPFPSNMFMFF